MYWYMWYYSQLARTFVCGTPNLPTVVLPFTYRTGGRLHKQVQGPWYRFSLNIKKQLLEDEGFYFYVLMMSAASLGEMKIVLNLWNMNFFRRILSTKWVLLRPSVRLPPVIISVTNPGMVTGICVLFSNIRLPHAGIEPTKSCKNYNQYFYCFDRQGQLSGSNESKKLDKLNERKGSKFEIISIIYKTGKLSNNLLEMEPHSQLV